MWKNQHLRYFLDRKHYHNPGFDGQTRLYQKISIDLGFSGNNTENHQTQQDMKKIIIIDGGPRRNMNTAQMLQKFAEGAQSAGEHI